MPFAPAVSSRPRFGGLFFSAFRVFGRFFVVIYFVLRALRRVHYGFAHGFQVLSDEAVFTYKVDNRYAPEAEASIRFDDPDLAIRWPIADRSEVILSEKDLTRAVAFREADLFD